MMKKTGIFSFFAGAGFLDLGFEKTGKFDTVFVNEYHKPFMDIYKGARKMMDTMPPKYGYEVKDVTKYAEAAELEKLSSNLRDAKLEYEITGFIGGPPCPDFSVGGKNKGKHGENGKLSGTYIDLITKTKPDFFLFENVKGLYRTVKHREFFEVLKTKLKSNGYYLTENLINAIEYGAPQDRQRIILIGFHKSFLLRYVKPAKFQQTVDEFNWTAHTIFDQKEIFRKDWPLQDIFAENATRALPLNITEELTVQHWFNKNDVENHPNAGHYFQPRAGLAKFMTIPEGDDKKKSYKRLHRWRYSPTVAYGNNEVHLHPFLPRRLSVAESLALQSLPKDFVIPAEISLSDMFKTIGNGVPYLAARGLANTIADFITSLQSKTNAPVYEETHSG